MMTSAPESARRRTTFKAALLGNEYLKTLKVETNIWVLCIITILNGGWLVWSDDQTIDIFTMEICPKALKFAKKHIFA